MCEARAPQTDRRQQCFRVGESIHLVQVEAAGEDSDGSRTVTRQPIPASRVILLQVALVYQQSQNVTGSLALVQSLAQLAHFQIWDTQALLWEAHEAASDCPRGPLELRSVGCNLE